MNIRWVLRQILWIYMKQGTLGETDYKVTRWTRWETLTIEGLNIAIDRSVCLFSKYVIFINSCVELHDQTTIKSYDWLELHSEFLCCPMPFLCSMWIKVCAMISALRVTSLNCTLLFIFPEQTERRESQCKLRAMQRPVRSKIKLSATKTSKEFFYEDKARLL